MEWDDVRVFLALLRAHNLAEAAQALGVDRSTVSRRLTALERTLAARLFVRTREGVRPTAAGTRLRAHAERMEAEALALRQAASAGSTRVGGVVRVATTEALAQFLVAEGLLSLRQQHPSLVVELLGGNRPLDLTRGEADLALRVSTPHEPALRVRCIARLGLGLFASPEYLRARGLPRAARDLAGHDVLLPAGELARLPEARWLAARRGVHVALRSSAMGALVAAAVAGHGLVPLTLPWGDGEPRLERVLTLPELGRRALWLVSPPGEAAPAVRVVAERIAAVLARAVDGRARAA